MEKLIILWQVKIFSGMKHMLLFPTGQHNSLERKIQVSNSDTASMKWLTVCISSTFHQYILNKKWLSYITFCLTLLKSQVMICMTTAVVDISIYHSSKTTSPNVRILQLTHE